MAKETLKDWCKKWSVKQIIGAAVSEGIAFTSMPNYTGQEIIKFKKVLVNEINRRLRIKKS